MYSVNVKGTFLKGNNRQGVYSNITFTFGEQNSTSC